MPHPIGFGRSNSFPIRLGGGESTSEALFAGLLAEYAKGFSTEEFTENWCETYGEAVALSIIYATNGRVSRQMIPGEMQENLPVWEDILQIPKVDGASLVRRRAAVASKMRTMVKNALTDLAAAATGAMGANFTELRTTPDDDVWFYMPGVNPGPEGMPFASNRAIVTFVVNKNNLNDFAFNQKVETLASALRGIAPGWQWFTIGIDSGSGFVPLAGVVDLTLL